MVFTSAGVMILRPYIIASIPHVRKKIMESHVAEIHQATGIAM
ncbi:MAG: hypothetical protein ABR519_02710 [Bacteroidales bacterium]